MFESAWYFSNKCKWQSDFRQAEGPCDGEKSLSKDDFERWHESFGRMCSLQLKAYLYAL